MNNVSFNNGINEEFHVKKMGKDLDIVLLIEEIQLATKV